ncbi:uncharacterized protein [Dysidea avara]|uniref:uncharacterized protein n=1 Tax=Dysidea avara TaxID=196820 RepID=UPI003332DBC6
MSKSEGKPESRPVIVPDCFSGEESYEDWMDQFESIAEINCWDEEQKLKWLKVRLKGRALMAYKKFSVTARAMFKNAKKALQERFEPESRKDLYLAEFQTRYKAKTESWPDFGEDLRVLVDKAYPSLDGEARQQLALQRYLSQLDNEQVAFSVKQRKPKTIEAAVSITLECESFLIKSTSARAGAVAPVRVESNDSTLLEMMTQLMARLDKLEEQSSKQVAPKRRVEELPSDRETTAKQRGLCPAQEVLESGKLTTLGEATLAPREMTRAFELFNFAVSIVNPSMSFSVTATINGSAVVFLVDSGSALTILRKDTWEKCKESGQNLRPWNQKRLVGAEGSQLRVFGSAEVTVDIQGVGHVVTLHCQQQNMKLTADLVDVYRIEADPGGSDATSFMCSNVESSQHIESPQQESNVKLFQQDSLTCHNQEVDDQSVKSSCVFSVKVQDNVRIPSYSEMEILACVNWCTQNLSSCYVLECNLRNSDLFVARALVKGGSSVFIRLLNPTGKPVTLYSGANVATLSEAVEIVDNHKSVNGINLDSGISVSTVSHDIGKELKYFIK